MRNIEVVSYIPQWAQLFEQEKTVLLEQAGSVIERVHHIGSTSVVGLSAKPVIDIILEVTSLEDLDRVQSVFEGLGYQAMGEYGIPQRRFYMKGGECRSHHIHAFCAGHSHVQRHLAFRDYLRAHPQALLEYQALKIKTAASCNNDIEQYCDGKNDFIKTHEAKALKWLAERQ